MNFDRMEDERLDRRESLLEQTVNDIKSDIASGVSLTGLSREEDEKFYN